MKAWVQRAVPWWADRQLTPEEMAQRAAERQGQQGALHPVYRHLFEAPTSVTRGLALTGRALAWRHRN